MLLEVVLCRIVQANFYEKALFVKPTWRPLRGVTRLLCPSRYASIRTLEEPSLWWLGAQDEIRLFEPKALQSSERSLLLAEDGPSSHGAVTFRSEARSGEIGRGRVVRVVAAGYVARADERHRRRLPRAGLCGKDGRRGR